MKEEFAQSALGSLFEQYQRTQARSREVAMADLWKRNKLTPNAPGYKIAETKMVKQDGTSVIEYRLYKLIDARVVTTSAQVTADVEDGVKAVRENRGATEFPSERG